ncbi:MAG: hypothetical protein U9Q69_02400 [Nanoarchaeota archaeon]|nr:hypothetical protein [Nanoarchaeota archaeon]
MVPPFVSIVVPAWNEEKTIAGTLSSAMELNYPKDRLDLKIPKLMRLTIKFR